MTEYLEPAELRQPGGVRVCVVLMRVAAVGLWVCLIPVLVAMALQAFGEPTEATDAFTSWEAWAGIAVASLLNIVWGLVLWAASHALVLVAGLDRRTNMTAAHEDPDSSDRAQPVRPQSRADDRVAGRLRLRKAAFWVLVLRIAAVVVWCIGVVRATLNAVSYGGVPLGLFEHSLNLLILSQLLATLVRAFAVGVVLWAASYVLLSLLRMAARAPGAAQADPYAPAAGEGTPT